ncbi:MAG TPA: hypothetical protein EYG21_06485 [Nitrospinaceae bacterium]|jgi:hypothetical protein|nr:hypothetical protein [Nitrospinaceae bacterium]
MEKILNDSELRTLRAMGAITVDEIAYRVGDLVVAENVLTKERRTLNENNNTFSESSKRLLKG